MHGICTRTDRGVTLHCCRITAVEIETTRNAIALNQYSVRGYAFNTMFPCYYAIDPPAIKLCLDATDDAGALGPHNVDKCYPSVPLFEVCSVKISN